MLRLSSVRKSLEFVEIKLGEQIRLTVLPVNSVLRSGHSVWMWILLNTALPLRRLNSQ